MQSFNHRTDKRARASEASNDVENQVPEERKIRGRNKLHRPRNGQITIIPEGDKYVHTEICINIFLSYCCSSSLCVVSTLSFFLNSFFSFPLCHWGSQFRYAKYSIDDTMKKGPILGVILKKGIPSHHWRDWQSWSAIPISGREVEPLLSHC